MLCTAGEWFPGRRLDGPKRCLRALLAEGARKSAGGIRGSGLPGKQVAGTDRLRLRTCGHGGHEEGVVGTGSGFLCRCERRFPHLSSVIDILRGYLSLASQASCAAIYRPRAVAAFSM